MAILDPFNESEKAELLREIISSSNLPSQALASIVYELQISPSWDDTRLPAGRTMRQCQAVFNEIMSSSPRYRPPVITDPRAHSSLMNPPRLSMPPEISFAAGRSIQPRPPHIAPFTAESPMSPYSPTSSETQARRRGRPNRAEAERRKRRKAEAAARGEKDPYPSRPRKKTKITETPAAETELGILPQSTTFTAITTSATSGASLLGFTSLPPPRSLAPTSSSPGPTLAPILSTAPPDIGGTFGRTRPERSAPTSRPPPSGFSIPPARAPGLPQYEPYPASSYPPEQQTHRSTPRSPRREPPPSPAAPVRQQTSESTSSQNPPAEAWGESMEH